jgi:hypothetical protein
LETNVNLPSLIAVMCVNREWPISAVIADRVKAASLTRDLNLLLGMASSVSESEVIAAAAIACRAEANKAIADSVL